MLNGSFKITDIEYENETISDRKNIVTYIGKIKGIETIFEMRILQSTPVFANIKTPMEILLPEINDILFKDQGEVITVYSKDNNNENYESFYHYNIITKK